MVSRFFFSSVNSPNPFNDSIILLSGPTSSGKTSLLFQFALNNNSSAVFICSRRKLHANPPFLSKGVDASDNAFDRIQIKYVEDEEGINKFFAAFHMYDNFPGLVIIDDFGEFFNERNCQQRYNSPRGRELAIVRTLALCRNAISHANETRGTCMLLFSDTHLGDTPKFLHIYNRWVNCIYTIKGDEIGSFIISTSGLDMARTKVAKYSISLQYLVLEDMYENEERRH
ncbi:uncharacterized protein LOC143633960 [Bidens hawaiensis]|uniref:uncharacterized protein LOC143633960 n=1 Tax=Bidens hawaiensis TaxID=980011 RepID=UPI00404AC2CA